MLGCLKRLRGRSWGRRSPSAKIALTGFDAEALRSAFASLSIWLRPRVRRLKRYIRPWYQRIGIQAWTTGAVVAVLCLAILGIVRPGTSRPVDVSDQLAKAEAAFNEDRLSYPTDESALYYYQQVLLIDADNVTAREGIDKIAGRYAVLAERDLSRARLDSAETLVTRGLSVDPDNERLLGLETEIAHRSSRRPRRFVDRVKSIFK
jgi:hypothetical protein